MLTIRNTVFMPRIEVDQWFPPTPHLAQLTAGFSCFLIPSPYSHLMTLLCFWPNSLNITEPMNYYKRLQVPHFFTSRFPCIFTNFLFCLWLSRKMSLSFEVNPDKRSLLPISFVSYLPSSPDFLYGDSFET